MATELTGYKKRLARRRSGNPGPNQQWVPALVRYADGSTGPHPNAARAVSEHELRASRRYSGAEVETWGAP